MKWFLRKIWEWTLILVISFLASSCYIKGIPELMKYNKCIKKGTSFWPACAKKYPYAHKRVSKKFCKKDPNLCETYKRMHGE